MQNTKLPTQHTAPTQPRSQFCGPHAGPIDDLRRLVAVMNCCNESFLQRFTIDELVRVFSAHQRCEWDFYPDQWTEAQVQQALRGEVPTGFTP
jgi:hypothetical protein